MIEGLSTPDPTKTCRFWFKEHILLVLVVSISVMGVHNLACNKLSSTSIPYSSPRIAHSVVGMLSIVAIFEILVIFYLAFTRPIAVLILAIIPIVLVIVVRILVAILRLLAPLWFRRVIEIAIFGLPVIL